MSVARTFVSAPNQTETLPGRGRDHGGQSACRHECHDRFGQGTPSVDASGMPGIATTFLDADDGLGPRKALRQTRIITFKTAFIAESE